MWPSPLRIRDSCGVVDVTGVRVTLTLSALVAAADDYFMYIGAFSPASVASGPQSSRRKLPLTRVAFISPPVFLAPQTQLRLVVDTIQQHL